MVKRTAAVLVLFALLACGRKVELAGDDTEATTQPSESSGTSSGTPTETETETETGDEMPSDACPATPALDSLHGIFDGIEVGYEFPEEADWIETCTVTAHTGDLIAGETITLDCVTSEGLAVMHVLEHQASLIDAAQPMQIPVEVGESLQLTFWSRVWFAGGASWVLRDAEQLDDIRLIYYSTIELFEDYDSPAPAFVEPLAVTVHSDVCETFCPEPPEDTGTFVPPDECDCEREQALEFVLGPDSAVIQNGSAGAIGSSMFTFVKTAMLYPIPPLGACADHSGAWYTFLVVAR